MRSRFSAQAGRASRAFESPGGARGGDDYGATDLSHHPRQSGGAASNAGGGGAGPDRHAHAWGQQGDGARGARHLLRPRAQPRAGAGAGLGGSVQLRGGAPRVRSCRGRGPSGVVPGRFQRAPGCHRHIPRARPRRRGVPPCGAPNRSDVAVFPGARGARAAEAPEYRDHQAPAGHVTARHHQPYRACVRSACAHLGAAAGRLSRRHARAAAARGGGGGATTLQQLARVRDGHLDAVAQRGAGNIRDQAQHDRTGDPPLFGLRAAGPGDSARQAARAALPQWGGSAHALPCARGGAGALQPGGSPRENRAASRGHAAGGQGDRRRRRRR
mmetsp:Transcript_38033/g.120077  ORF Transcript_38033/g.120077 Transcript_38033/m.120077 type:complete len:329 (+) Transcript_38033:506-1492(+)